MPVMRLNHAVLYVRDVRASVDFYTSVLGFRLVSDLAGLPGAAFLQASGSSNDHDLGLFQIGATAAASGAGRTTVGLYHLAWEVDTLEELQATAQRLAEAVALARAGCDVGITWHEDKDGAEATADEVRAVGRHAEVRRLDLTELPAAADVIDELADALSGVDVLVNNAGTGISSPFVETSYDDWRRVLATDLDGAFLCAQRAVRRMLDHGRGGHIVNITSVHEHQPKVGSSAYCAAKGGLGLLTKVMAIELAPEGI